MLDKGFVDLGSGGLQLHSFYESNDQILNTAYYGFLLVLCAKTSLRFAAFPLHGFRLLRFFGFLVFVVPILYITSLDTFGYKDGSSTYCIIAAPSSSNKLNLKDPGIRCLAKAVEPILQ